MVSPTGSVSYWLRRRLGISEVRREKFLLATKRLGEVGSAIIHHRMGRIGVAILASFVLVALIAPLIAPWDPFLTVDEQYVPPATNAPIIRNESFHRSEPVPTENIALFANESRGWGLSNTTISEPGPTIVVLRCATVTLTLSTNDSARYRWFLDYDNNLSADQVEPASIEFSRSASVALSFVADRPGNWTYRDAFHNTTMTGSFLVEQSHFWCRGDRAARLDDVGLTGQFSATSDLAGQWMNVSGFEMRIFRNVVESVGIIARVLPETLGTDPGQYVAVRVSVDGGRSWSGPFPIRPAFNAVTVNVTNLTVASSRVMWDAEKANGTNLVLNITHESDSGTIGIVALDYIGVRLVWRSYWHLFGTDQDGRDIYSRVIWGSRISLLVGFLSSVIAGVLGTLVGLVSGFWGGWRDEILMRINDILLSLPWLALLIVLAAILGGVLSLNVIIVVIGLTSWSFTARVVRAQVLSVKERTFVERARASGAGSFSILRKHIFPNVFPLVFANTILTVAVAILSESTLAFLGKVQPGTLSWGVILHEAEQTSAILNGRWTWIMMPGLALVFVILGFSLLGYSLDEILNPKLRER